MTNTSLKGHVTIVLENVITGKKEIHKFKNSITQFTKQQVTGFILGETPPDLPSHIGIGIGQGPDSDQYTELVNPQPYGTDTTLIAKEAHSIQRLGQTSVRYITSFLVEEANFTITELGLYNDETAGSDLWARLIVNITKTSLQRLTIYWYIDFNEADELTLLGESIHPNNTLAAIAVNTRYIYQFQSPVYKVLLSLPIKNKDLNSHMRIKINAGVGWTNNNIWDYRLFNGDYLIIDNLEVFSIGIVYIVTSGNADANILNNFLVRGWG